MERVKSTARKGHKESFLSEHQRLLKYFFYFHTRVGYQLLKVEL